MSDTPSATAQANTEPQVALFVTCLADLFRPSVGFASLNLLESAGYLVSVPMEQTCCGQPAYNSGDYDAARALARRVVEMLAPADYVVVPSGSCAGMLCHHYPRLLHGEWHDRALELAAKTFELTTFLEQIAPRTAGRAKQLDARAENAVASACANSAFANSRARCCVTPAAFRQSNSNSGMSAAVSAAPSAQKCRQSQAKWLTTNSTARWQPAPTRSSAAISAACCIWPDAQSGAV